jgi:hypothetical protein
LLCVPLVHCELLSSWDHNNSDVHVEPLAKRCDKPLFEVIYTNLAELDKFGDADKILNVCGLIASDWTCSTRSERMSIYKATLLTNTVKVSVVLMGRRPEGLDRGTKLAIVGQSLTWSETVVMILLSVVRRLLCGVVCAQEPAGLSGKTR